MRGTSHFLQWKFHLIGKAAADLSLIGKADWSQIYPFIAVEISPNWEWNQGLVICSPNWESWNLDGGALQWLQFWNWEISPNWENEVDFRLSKLGEIYCTCTWSWPLSWAFGCKLKQGLNIPQDLWNSEFHWVSQGNSRGAKDHPWNFHQIWWNR